MGFAALILNGWSSLTSRFLYKQNHPKMCIRDSLQAGHFEPAADIIVNWGYFTAGKQGILLLLYKYPAFPVLCAGEAIGGVAVLQNGLISK